MSVSSHKPRYKRELIHQPEYDLAVEKIFDSLRRGDDAMRGLEFFLCRQAERGLAYREFDPQNIATWLSVPLEEGQVRVVYKFDNDRVYLINAWLVPYTSTFGD